ncbi:glycosyltransferase family 39 protein [Luteibacter yeojuensis]|uniref:Glycosyltransferase RgtA/B/C/D-like domain-containing protein n=1 Tax=Luteibacter yeojuensis TaxID=345309 RepID=A0A7X5TQN7_9GAMM|nr:glycosyltransferase family 39 protein [Luteibacter yeojuensis]NID16756.1 hypothetical protein [Luteibacter yeojuensis]
MSGTDSFSTTRGRTLVLAAIVLAAFVMRYSYVRIAVVDSPLRGDAWQYFCYAWNLLKHGTFSLARPMAENVVPDSFRDPGYPTLLAILMAVRGTGREVYDTLLLTQCLLGAASVGFVTSLACRWMGFGAACAAGVLGAFWPHLVGFAGYVLSETLLGFLIMLAIWLLDTALRRESRAMAIGAGLGFAGAALTNAVLLPMAPLLAIVMVRRDAPRRTFWVALLLAAALPSGAWMVRNLTLPAENSAGGRASINFVQGSWPEYHTAAFRAIQLGDPAAKAVMDEIDRETHAMQASPREGWSLMSQRMAADPLRYARWYASKPALLWGWDVAVGQGDIYVFPTFHSLFEDNAVFHAWAGICFLLNPLIALLALIGTIHALLSNKAPLALRWAAAIVAMATAVFCLLQAEPRYAVPYRGLEFLLAAWGIAVLGHLLATRWRRISA